MQQRVGAITPGAVVVIGGVPGTGKSVVADLMSMELGCEKLEVSALAKDLGVACRDPTGRDTMVLCKGAIEKIAEHLSRKLDSVSCIMAATVYPELVIPYLNTLIPFVVILRTNPLRLMERLAIRPWPRRKILENVLAEAFNVLWENLWEYEHMIIEVDTTGITPGKAVIAIMDKLERWETGFTIDWLEDDAVSSRVPVWISELDSYRDRVADTGSD